MKTFLTLLFMLLTSNVFACQYDGDCAVGQYCKNGTISFETQEGTCVQKTEFQENPGSIFDDIKKRY